MTLNKSYFPSQARIKLKKGFPGNFVIFLLLAIYFSKVKQKSQKRLQRFHQSTKNVSLNLIVQEK